MTAEEAKALAIANAKTIENISLDIQSKAEAGFSALKYIGIKLTLEARIDLMKLGYTLTDGDSEVLIISW